MKAFGEAWLNFLRNPVHKARLCLALWMAGMLGKFWLIANSDIADAQDDPSEYIVQVLHPMQGGVAYGPGTGLFGHFFYGLGIPFRIGIELVFMFALTWVLRALIEWPRKSYLACGLFLFAIFDPTPAELFSHFLSDQIWMVLTMIGLAYLVLALRDPLQPKAVLLTCSTLLLGFAVITRSFFALLMGCLILFIVVSTILIIFRSRFAKPRTSLSTFLLSTLFVVLGTSTIYYMTCFFNLQRLHYFGISAVDCQEYRDFYLCLQSVGEPTGVAHYPVDADRRRLIATAGPHAKALMTTIDHYDYYQQVGEKAYGRHDVALGWIQFAVFGAYNGDIDKAYVEFREIEREIRDAGQRGPLTVRSILPLPDCRLNLVLPGLPGALRTTLEKTVAEPVPYSSGWKPQKAHYENPDFTRALHRHAVSDSPARFRIWKILHAFYSCLYRPALVVLLLALVMGYWIYLAIAWRPTWDNSLALLAKEMFALTYFALIFWYGLFDASGTPTMDRYMILNHVLLPILLVYYLQAWMKVLVTRSPQGSAPSSRSQNAR